METILQTLKKKFSRYASVFSTRMAVTQLFLLVAFALSHSVAVSAPATKPAVAAFVAAHSFPGMEPPRTAAKPDGYLSFYGATPGHPTHVTSLPASAEHKSVARGFLSENSALFHEQDSSISYTIKNEKVSGPRHYSRFQQTYGGVPVFAAETIVQTTGAAPAVESVLSDIMRTPSENQASLLDLIPTLYPKEASDSVLGTWQKRHPGIQLKISKTPELQVYCPSVIGDNGPAALVYKCEVQDTDGGIVDDVVLVDAHSGEVALEYTRICDAKDRRIYDANGTAADPGALVRSEGQAASGIFDADVAYAYYGDTYDFYLNIHGRDGIDGRGFPLSATVRLCPGDQCPYQNAYWSSAAQRMYFGAGFAAADDVVAHELTHGVTEHESGLIYRNESGAINESFSDMWGEWVDQSNTGGTDTVNVKWLMGEDIPGMGAIRNMKNPPQFNHPDRKGSPNWYTGFFDAGGVHTNSGVGNKLCYLLTDGDTFNGHTVTGLGIARAAQLFYEAQANLLTAGSDYADLHTQLTQAAINLGYTAAERANVEEACLAVELSLDVVRPPANDNFDYAFFLPEGINFVTFGSNVGATKEAGEPYHAGNYGGASTWWAIIPTNPGTVTISTEGSDFNTLLAVYTGYPVAELSPVASNDDIGNGQTCSRVTFECLPGMIYWIAVDGFGGAEGNIFLNYSVSSNAPPPANDNFANATPLPAGPGTVSGSNAGATKESNEPNHAGFLGGKSVWYSLRASATGTLTINTNGSSFDTLLGVYTGSFVGALTEVASNDDSGGTPWSSVTFDCVARTTYYIAVDGFGGREGTIALNYATSFTELQVTIQPAGAITAGAQWNVDGGAYQNSGVSIWSLSAGAHTVGFKAVPGWNSPASQSVIISNNATSSATGTYTQQTGSLKVTIGPTGAVTAGALWNVDGGVYHLSGATDSSVSVGSHTVNFKSVSGWNAPASQSVTIAKNVTTAVTGTYTPPSGSLQVTISPAGAISAGAKWNVDGGTYQSSGATISSLAVGSHTVSFKAVTGWNAPASRSVTIANGVTTALTGTYTPPSGSLQVTISPAGAVTAGAQWNVDGGVYQNSGITVTSLSVGSHTVSFKAVYGWNTPAAKSVTVSNNATTLLGGTYTQQTGSLKVTISPAGAVTAGAKWNVDGGTYQNSGATVSSLTVGSHIVNFKAVSGWNAPASQSVTIANSVTTAITGTYTPPSGSLQVTISPAGAVSAGAQWNVDGGVYQLSGATVSSLAVGSHTVSFKAVSGWNSPVSQVVTIANNATSTVTGAYTQQTGSLIVTINPTEAVNARALWNIDGGVYYPSGLTVLSLAVGSYTVNFKPVYGWTAPASQSVTIANGVTTAVTGTYVASSNGTDYFTELFDPSANDSNDLDNRTIIFSPSGSNYTMCGVGGVSTFPTDPSGGTALSLSDDFFAQVQLTAGAQVRLYGVNYSSFFVGSNGYITFGTGDTSYAESLDAHFNQPRISALFDDLNPSVSGTISWKQLSDRVAVTYQNVPEFNTADSNSFQVEMFFDGTIRMTWLGIDAGDGVAGLSAGGGVPADYSKSDLSAAASCTGQH